MEFQACLHPHACQIPLSRVPGDGGRVVWGRAFPDCSRHSEEHGGKIFKQAMKSDPGLLNTWR